MARLGLLILALHGARAARIGEDLGDASEFSSGAGVGSTGGTEGEIICGGERIWKMLTASDSVTSIQNINFEKIMVIADDYVEDMTTEEKKLKTSTGQLMVRIALKQQMEAPAYTTEEELTKLITDSIVPAFGSVEKASETQCGRPTFRPRPPPGSHRQSKAQFKIEADKLFTSTKRLASDLFLPICHKMLKPEPADGWCKPLCQSFMTHATSLSSARAGETGGLGSDALIKDLNAQLEKLERVKSEIARCENTKNTIGVFREQVQQLKVVQEERFDELQDAEIALDDALYGLDQIEQSMKAEQGALDVAEDALQGDNAAVAGLQSAILATAALKGTLLTKLVASKAVLTAVKSDLMETQDATSAALDLRGVVSKVMLQMRQFFVEAVTQPLMFMGLDEDCKVDNYFIKDSNAATEAAKFLVTAVDKLDEYCDTTAKPAFDAVEDSVKLHKLCEIGSPEDFKKEAVAAVTKKEGLVKKGIQGVLDWMDVYNHNRGMTQQKAQERVEAGETPGFQEVVGVYAKTTFFKNYLRNWRLGGPMLKLIQDLKELSARLTADVAKAEEAIRDLGKQINDLNAKIKQLVADLKAAQAKQLKSAQKKAKVKKAIKQLEAESAKVTADLDALRKAVEVAKVNCEKADQALVDALEEAKSSVKSKSLLEEELRGLEIEGEQKVWEAKRAVARAERHLLAMQEWSSA